MLSYEIRHTGFDSGEIAGHIHGPVEQACGSEGAGPIVVTLPQGTTKSGTATLTPQEQAELMQGLYYVNLHSPTFVPGEISDVIQHVEKNRAMSFVVPTAAGGAVEQAVRVRLREVYVDADEDPLAGCPVRTEQPNLSVFEGAASYRWLGEPAVVSDETVPANAEYLVAPLECGPHFRDWTPAGLADEFGSEIDVGVIHAFGPAVVPCSYYEVQFVDTTCADLEDEECYTYPKFVRTAKWGDVAPPYGGSGQPSFIDIGTVVRCFKSIPLAGGQNKLRCLLRENVLPLGQKASFIEIGLVVSGFKSLPYPNDGPGLCDPCP